MLNKNPTVNFMVLVFVLVFVCLFVCLVGWLFICSCVCLFVCLSVCLGVCLSVCLFVSLFVCFHVLSFAWIVVSVVLCGLFFLTPHCPSSSSTQFPRFPEIGVPPVLIHFRLGFSMKYTIQHFWGTPMTMETPRWIPSSSPTKTLAPSRVRLYRAAPGTGSTCAWRWPGQGTEAPGPAVGFVRGNHWEMGRSSILLWRYQPREKFMISTN